MMKTSVGSSLARAITERERQDRQLVRNKTDIETLSIGRRSTLGRSSPTAGLISMVRIDTQYLKNVFSHLKTVFSRSRFLTAWWVPPSRYCGRHVARVELAKIPEASSYCTPAEA
jgi:hypothetical protein